MKATRLIIMRTSQVRSIRRQIGTALHIGVLGCEAERARLSDERHDARRRIGLRFATSTKELSAWKGLPVRADFSHSAGSPAWDGELPLGKYVRYFGDGYQTFNDRRQALLAHSGNGRRF